MSETSKALIAAVAAFSCWGLFPLFWKLFPELPGETLFMQRLWWSLLTLLLLVPLSRRGPKIREILRDQRKWWLILSAALISSNWLVYVVAVTQGHILEASMGYFLNPMINILVGHVFLKEVIRRSQWPAIFCAFLGVAWMIISSGLTHIPWVALFLSLTFALYGVIRKLTKVGALEGLTFETAVVFIPISLWWLHRGGDPLLDSHLLSGPKLLLLSLAGVITCLPLVLFAFSTRRLSLQALGFCQYMSPSLKFLCGWLVFHEPLTNHHWIGFSMIWLGSALYVGELFLTGQRNFKS